MKKEIKQKYILLLAFVVITGCVFAAQDTASVKYNFDGDNAAWQNNAPEQWSISSEKVQSGTNSLKFKVDAKDVLENTPALYSIETGYTIMQVRTQQVKDETRLIGTSYEGTLVCFNYDGLKIWENKLSGFMNHDVSCQDIDGDGKEEVLAANADGTLYCLDDDGSDLWKFRKNNAPMNAVTMISNNESKYIACGGFDKNIYYVSVDGRELKRIAAKSYSIDKQSGVFDHHINFLRTVTINNKEVLLVHSSMNTNWSQGAIYLFSDMETVPYKKLSCSVSGGQCSGTIAINDLASDSIEVILGGNNLGGLFVTSVNITNDDKRLLDTKHKSSDIGPAGYRMASVAPIKIGDEFNYYVAYGNRLLIVSPNANVSRAEVLTGTYAYNGMTKDAKNEKLLLASTQSGGSCIHVIDYKNNAWKDMYKSLDPPGKMARILKNTSEFRSALSSFSKPAWEREQLELLVMSGGASSEVENEITAINANSPKFISTAGIYPHVEERDRSSFGNAKYEAKRDKRKSYDYNQEQCVNALTQGFNNSDHGIQFWAGHGSDPMYYALPTLKEAIDKGNGKNMITVFAELESYDNDFKYMMDNYMYPLAEYFNTRKGIISLRNKHLFWQSVVHTPAWTRLVSGEFADAVVSSMEESNSKTMDMSTSGRMGLWASGAMNKWGARFTRDNVCYDRLRQISYQRVPNHSLRMFVWNIANGASVIHNTSVNAEYTDVLWYMIAKGILFIPKREEIVSFNPIHLSMLNPDPLFLEGNHVKVTTGYSESHEKANPMVVGNTSGSWPGAPVSDWDFSKYATGANERRLEFLPPYPNGMVLTTPPNDESSARGVITDHLNPIYKEIMEEVFTDGRNYYEGKGKTGVLKADEYGPTIAQRVKDAAKKLPLTVDGRVAWVTAQTAPKHLRLTLVDGGYVNPNDREAVVTFHTANVKQITNLVSGESVPFSKGKATVQVPCGLWTFLDIELNEAL